MALMGFGVLRNISGYRIGGCICVGTKYDRAFFVNKLREFGRSYPFFLYCHFNYYVIVFFFVISATVAFYVHLMTIYQLFMISLTIIIVSIYQIFYHTIIGTPIIP